MASPETLIDAGGIRIDRLANAGLTVRVARRPFYGIATLALVVSPFAALAAVISGGVSLMAIYFPRDGAGPTLVFIALFGAMALLAWWGTFVTTLMALRFCFDRILEFEMHKGELRLCNVPRFSRTTQLSNVVAVDICCGCLRGVRVIWLCLSVQGMKRKLLIQSAIPSTRSEKELAKVLVAAGTTISRLLNVPLHKLARVGLLEISFI